MVQGSPVIHVRIQIAQTCFSVTGRYRHAFRVTENSARVTVHAGGIPEQAPEQAPGILPGKGIPIESYFYFPVHDGVLLITAHLGPSSHFYFTNHGYPAIQKRKYRYPVRCFYIT
jgi:hypothetical protein